jgi:hypothetical protein
MPATFAQRFASSHQKTKFQQVFPEDFPAFA